MNRLLLVFLSLSLLNAFGQQAYQITKLSDQIKETSGLLFVEGNFYTFNDSGGEPALYQIDTTSGEVRQIIQIVGARNNDWEAITFDSEYIYIGDIGNNYGNRKDLVIYKCPLEGLSSGKLLGEEIKISYKDQDDFDHKPHHHEYDAEALFIRDGKLYLISKNWIKDESKIYEVPMKAGQYKLEYEEKIDVFGKVTDACYDDELKVLFLIGYGKFPFITYLKGFDGNRSSTEITLPINSPNGLQTEGITVVGNKIYYTSEQVQIFDAELSRYFITDFENLVNVSVKGHKIKINASIKIDVIKIESKKGKDLIKFENVNKNSKGIPIRALDKKDKVNIKIVFENGAEYRTTLNL